MSALLLIEASGMETFTGLSWQEAMGLAVQLLPGATIQWDSEDEAVVSVVIEPEAGPCNLRIIRVHFYSTLRDHGWPSELDDLFGLGGSFERMSDRPVLAISADRHADEQLILADQISTEELAAKVLRVLSMILGSDHWATSTARRLDPARGKAALTAAHVAPVEPGGASLTFASQWEGVRGQPRWQHVFTRLDPCLV